MSRLGHLIAVAEAMAKLKSAFKKRISIRTCVRNMLSAMHVVYRRQLKCSNQQSHRALCCLRRADDVAQPCEIPHQRIAPQHHNPSIYLYQPNCCDSPQDVGKAQGSRQGGDGAGESARGGRSAFCCLLVSPQSTSKPAARKADDILSVVRHLQAFCESPVCAILT